jgi:hypothetical protein
MSDTKSMMAVVTAVSQAAEMLETALEKADEFGRDEKLNEMIQPLLKKVKELASAINERTRKRYDDDY